MAQMLTKKLSTIEYFDAKEAQLDLKKFVSLSWHVIEPGKPFTGGWHIDSICDHLEAVTRGDIKRLLVNMPPRHSKSSIIDVLWTVWLLLNNPSIRLLCGSYALKLATRDNLKARRLIKSPWFQARYHKRFKLTKDQDAKMYFETDKFGYRMAVSVGAAATGEGGDILILDDPHAIDDKESDAMREAAIDWFDNTWSSRLNDQQTGQMVVVGQRIHMNDVSGHILDTNDGEWVHLNLPAEYEATNPCRTYLPSGKELWSDPRTEEGQLLWEEKFPASVVKRAKRRHGPFGYAAIYQQRPIPASGSLFDEGNERLFSIDREAGLYLLETPRGIKPIFIKDCWHLTTSDVAAKEKQQNDWTVFSTWAITPSLDILLIDVKRGHWPIPEQKEQGYKVFQEFNTDTYQCIYFEDVGYQSAIGQELIALGVPCLPFQPEGDKVLRAGAASIWQRLGKLYFLKLARWLEELRAELYGFPKRKYDDQVDTVSMVCLIVRKPVPLSESRRDEDDAPPPAEETGGLIPLTEPLDPAKREDFVPLLVVEPEKIDPFSWADQHMGGDW